MLDKKLSRFKLLLLFFVLLFCKQSAYGLSRFKQAEVVALINGNPLFKDEFEFTKQSLRTTCITYFTNLYGAYDGPDFWDHSFNGEIPGEWLKARTLQKCKEQRVFLALLSQYGLLKDFNYQSFLADWEKQNTSREAMAAAGTVVYGNVSFDQQTYYAYLMSKAALDLERAFMQRSALTEADLRSYYNTLKIKQFKKQPAIAVMLYKLRPDHKRESVKISFTPAGSKSDELTWGTVYLKSKDLRSQGQRSTNFKDEDGNMCFVKCIAYKDDGFFSYEEVKEIVKKRYAEQQISKKLIEMNKACVLEIV